LRLWRIAERLGFSSVREMVDTLDEDTLNKWQAVALIDGWGDDNWRMARLAAAIHNSLIVCLHRQGVITADDQDFRDADHYMPRMKFERPANTARKQTAAELEALCKHVAGIK
jgi:thioester reductase-like protein